MESELLTTLLSGLPYLLFTPGSREIRRDFPSGTLWVNALKFPDGPDLGHRWVAGQTPGTLGRRLGFSQAAAGGKVGCAVGCWGKIGGESKTATVQEGGRWRVTTGS